MRTRTLVLFSAILAATLSSFGLNDGHDNRRDIKHVLLISVDGMHALDLTNYVAAHPNSALAQLSSHGITYTNASTPMISDSFPGLAALITGGSPQTTGLWYDVSFNRKLSPPAAQGANLCPGTIPTPVLYDESTDIDSSRLDAGGGLNPASFPRDPAHGCQPVFPHQYIRVNTIFSVARQAGLYTAWSDKHPSYEWVNGPGNIGTNDFFSPEINSAVVPLTTAPFDVPRCHTIPDPAKAADWTKSTLNVTCYDEIKVQAILNQIDGFTHDRSKSAPVPAIFGMNFQSVSVGQKLKGAGYTDVLGTPSKALAGDLDFVDQSLGRMVEGLKKNGLLDQTLIIISAKHGQSPIDIQKRTAIDDSLPATIVGAPYAFDISDDASLIWLKDPSDAAGVVANLSTPANQAALGIQEIFALQSITNKFDSPFRDERTPDILLKVNTGVIFTTGSKIAEHGGMNEDDVHVALLLSNPLLRARQVKTAVQTQQVAPTILKTLGLEPERLDAVRREHTAVLPFFFAGDED